MGTAIVVDLRQTNGTTFDGDDKLRYIRTHIKATDGLLTGEKIKMELFPEAILSTKKRVGSITADTTTAALLVLAKAFVGDNFDALKGCYFVSNGNYTVSVSTYHEIAHNDDGISGGSTIDLEAGDHLFIDNLVEGGGFLPLYTDVMIRSTAATGSYPDGTRWVDDVTNQAYVESANGVWTQTFVVSDVLASTATLPGTASENTKYAIGSTGTDNGIIVNYYTDHYIWSVMNNNYPLAEGAATEGASKTGLMSAAMASKLYNIQAGANLYIHPTFSPANQDLGTNETIDQVTFNNGHVSAISKQTIRSGNTSQNGLLQLATTTEAKAGTDSAKAVTSLGVKESILHFGGMRLYADISTADAYGHPNGTFALIQTGTVTI